MKLVVIGPAPPLRGGIAAHTAGLAAALTERGHAVDVISYSRLYPRWLHPGRDQRAAGAAPVGEPVVDTVSPWSWRRAARRLRASAAQAVLVEWWHPVCAPALRVLLDGAGAAPVIFVCHNSMPHEGTPLAGRLTRLALDRADAVLCHSRHVAAGIVARVAESVAVETAPMPQLIDLARPLPARAEARKRLGISAGMRVAAFVGHVRSYKGVDVLLDAWARASLPPSALLLVAGEAYGAGLRRELSAAAAEPGRRVIDRYLGDDEVVAAVRAAGVVVLPYRRASQSGLVPLVRALGTPLIASDAGGLPGQLEEGAGPGADIVVPAGDAAALAVALKRVLAEERPSDGSADVMRHTGRDAGPHGRAAAGSESWGPTVAAVESLVAQVARRAADAPVGRIYSPIERPGFQDRRKGERRVRGRAITSRLWPIRRAW